MKKVFLLVLVFTLIIGVFSGCNSSKDAKSNKSEAVNSEQIEQPKAENTPGTETKKEAEVKEQIAREYKAALYFHDSEAMAVIREDRAVTVEDAGNLDAAQKAKICIEELIKGSSNGLATSIPAATKVMSVKFDKDTLIVDLSRDFDKDHSGGSAGVLMTMSQLVLTLTELEGVKQVSFKVEGRTLEDFKGAIEFNKPFTRNEYEQYIKK